MTSISARDLSKTELTRVIKDKALELGYADVGITTADLFEGYREEMESRPGYDRWYDYSMGPYAGADPKTVMPEAKSIICVVFDFSKTAYPGSLTQCIGRAYLGRGYVAKPESLNGIRRLQFMEFLKNLGIKVDESGFYRIPERLATARAGLTTFGANNLAYADGCGSFIILTGLVVDCELDYDSPTIERPCPPECNKCVDACPTGALYAAGKLSYKECILAMQIDAAVIDVAMRSKMGLSIHGCDRCQEVCPRNKSVLKNATVKDPFIERLAEEFDLEKVLLLDDAYYERFVYPVMYNYITEKWILQRNASIALGNTGDVSHLPALERARTECPDEVQEYVEWSIERLCG